MAWPCSAAAAANAVSFSPWTLAAASARRSWARTAIVAPAPTPPSTTIAASVATRRRRRNRAAAWGRLSGSASTASLRGRCVKGWGAMRPDIDRPARLLRGAVLFFREMSDALPVVEVEGLVRRFGELTAVDGVSFEVRRGEIFGFLGPNGAGKSTTITSPPPPLGPTAGRAAIAGHDVVREPLRVREAIGIIFQDNSLDDRLTADQNLYIHSLLYDLPRDVYRARADALL